MRFGIDFSGKKEYENLDFITKAIQDVDWGLVGDIVRARPDQWFAELSDFDPENRFLKIPDAFQKDPRYAQYSRFLVEILKHFFIIGRKSIKDPTDDFEVDLITHQYTSRNTRESLPGIPIYKATDVNFWNILMVVTRSIYSRQKTRHFGSGESVRTKQILKSFGEKEGSTSSYVCRRRLEVALNKYLASFGEISAFPVKNLDLYVDFIDCIEEFICEDNSIAYSKFCQYKLKIAANLPIYEAKFQ